VQPLELIAGLVLLGLWVFFMSSTLQAMGGAFGLVLLMALFAAVH
jgi:hypothetical protein